MRQSLMLLQEITGIHPQTGSSESYFDIIDDWELIEASFLKQYGIRIRLEDDMSWSEFCSLLSGIMYDTPLGRIVSIRAEKDPKVIKEFSKEERKIRNEWILRRSRELRQNPKAYINYWNNFQEWAKNTFK